MDRPKLEVADIFRRYGGAYREKHGASMSTAQRRVMSAIEMCRTAALGGQIEQCDACGEQRICYRSCRNRHCPKCQSLARAEWIEHRQAELLNCEYFHVVFTVPDKIAAIAYQNKEVVYNILFQATAETLRTIAPIPNTWARRLASSPSCTPGDQLCCITRICIVWSPAAGSPPTAPAGSLASPASSCTYACCRYCSVACFWSNSRTPSTLANCSSSPPWKASGIGAHLSVTWSLSRKAKWVVYAKRPFAGPEQVLDYVGRYTHRVAISNNRLLDIEADQVSFRYKDYRDHSQQKTMTLPAEEFIRRFLLHVLPHGFHRIRYYGFLGNRNRQEKLTQCRQLLGMALPQMPPESSEVQDYRDRCEELNGVSLRLCPVCRRGHMVLVDTLAASRRPAIKDTS